jgi:hypothetical protein
VRGVLALWIASILAAPLSTLISVVAAFGEMWSKTASSFLPQPANADTKQAEHRPNAISLLIFIGTPFLILLICDKHVRKRCISMVGIITQAMRYEK